MKKNPAILEIKCKKCGKVTRHSLTKEGKYTCLICGNVDKEVKLKNVEVVFTPAFEIEPDTIIED